MSTHLITTGYQQQQHDTVDIGQFVKLLRRRAKTIMLFTLLSTGVALLHVLFATPQFTARGVLYLGDTQPSDGSADPASSISLSAYSTQSDVETQIELISTGALIERAVLETGLNAQIRPAGTPPLTYWRWKLFAHGRTSVFVPGPQALQVINAIDPGNYRLVTGPENSYKLYTRGGLFGGGRLVLDGVLGKPATGNGVSLLVQLADSRYQNDQSSIVKAGQSYNLDITAPDALANNILAGALSVTAGGSPLQPTKLAFLEFRWNDPYHAQIFVQQVMKDYIATQLAWKTEAASVTENFVTDQLTNVSKQLAQADQNLSSYQAQTGIINPEQSAQAVVTQMAQLQTKRAALLLQRQALQQLNDGFETKTGGVDNYLLSETNDTVLAGLVTSLSNALVKLQQLRMEYTGNDQNLQIQEAQVAELRGSIKNVVRNDLAAANRGLADIDQLMVGYHEQIKEQPAESLKVASLKRSSDLLGQLYQLLSQKAEQAQISKAATIVDTRIVTPSKLPLGASSPRAAITIIAGALVGLIAGIALVLAQRMFSGRFESEDQIRLAVGAPVYGAVPRQARALVGSNVFGPEQFSPFSEAFRLIKRNIYRNTDLGRAAVILVISASKEDGKTTIAANLAKTLADDGKRVVLVDCDLYLSRLQSMPSFSGALGLTDWLVTNKRPTLKSWPGEKFFLLPAGTMRSTRREPLNEKALAAVVAELSGEFDYLILDSPPLPIVSDGLTLGQLADLILSVVSVSHTMRRAFEVHNELINALDRPHGIIINGADGANYGGDEAYFLGEPGRLNRFTGWFRVN